MELTRAIHVKQVYNLFRANALTIDNIEKFYQQSHRARGGRPVRDRIIRHLNNEEQQIQHILFVGYKGCGKSTELNYIQKEIEGDFLTVSFSVFQNLNQSNYNYIELIILVMEQLFATTQKENLYISSEYLQQITAWLKSGEQETINTRFIGAEAEGGKAGIFGIPFLGNLFYKIRFATSTGSEIRESIRREIEPQISELIELCNRLFTEVNQAIYKEGKKGIVVIIEDIDKTNPNTVLEIFKDYSSILTQLNAHFIYTFPVSAYYSLTFQSIQPHFSDVCLLPMIKVNMPDGTEYAEGIEVMRQIVDARMDTAALFEDQQTLKQMIKMSGGSIRDLFIMVQEAAETAVDYEREKITDQDYWSAFYRLKGNYSTSIADFTDADGKFFSVKDYFATLVELAKSPDKKISNTEILLHLRESTCVLSYNEKQWMDVHPIVKEILKERKMWNGELDPA
jgi:hypothetical protein